VSTTTTKSRLGRLNLVTLPVVDQDRAIAFYEKLGFEKRTDVPFGDQYRWVEVYLPDDATGIALAPPPPGRPAEAKETGIALTTDDIDATHAYMREQGVDVDGEVARFGDPVPPMFWFRDADGHSLMVVQTQ